MKTQMVCKLKLGEKHLASFMYAVLKYKVQVTSSLCIGICSYSRVQMSHGVAEVMVVIDSGISRVFELEAGVELKSPPTLNVNNA